MEVKYIHTISADGIGRASWEDILLSKHFIRPIEVLKIGGLKGSFFQWSSSKVV
jgi:hypothetical protein